MKLFTLIAFFCLTACVFGESEPSVVRSVPICPGVCTSERAAWAQCRSVIRICEVVRCPRTRKFKCVPRVTPTPTSSSTPSATPSVTPSSTPSATPSPSSTPSPSPAVTIPMCPNVCVSRRTADRQCWPLRRICKVVSCGGHPREFKCAPIATPTPTATVLPRCPKICRSGVQGRLAAIRDCRGLSPFCVVSGCGRDGFWCARNDDI